MDPSSAGLWALAIVGWFVASVVWRLVSGRGLFARPRSAALFVERWASGRSGTGPVARLATARNCLQVQLTADELVITPHFPFTLGFMPELYDFDKRVRLDAIVRVQRLGGRFAEAIELNYTRHDGTDAVLQLLLRQGERFTALLAAQRAPLARGGAPGGARPA